MSERVLITGASSGIGEALAREYAAQGASVFLFARRHDRLEKIRDELLKTFPQSKILTFTGDVTSGEELKSAVSMAKQEWQGLDTIICNAATGMGDTFEATLKRSDDPTRRIMETNVFGVLNTLRAAWDCLKESRGRVVLIGSVNSYLSLAGGSAYCMSKHAIRGLADSLRAEVAKFGMSVTLICPGLIESEIRKLNEKGEFDPKIKDRAPAFLIMPAEKAARKIRRAAQKRLPELVITLHGKILVLLSRLLPVKLRVVLIQAIRS